MPAPTLGTMDWMAEELVSARLLEAGTARRLIASLREELPHGDAHALGDYLIRAGVATEYQVRRALDGDGKGLLVGPYLLLEPIGRGGMGVVYRAMGRADRRNYILKLLPARHELSVRQARKIVARFDAMPPHDGVVPFVDVGTANGQHYLVWPMIDGVPLERKVREQGAFSGEELARLGMQLAGALEACHARGVVHGYLKPTNVMLGYHGQARLLDFGVGALLAENADAMERLLDTFSAAQTTARMVECAAPELVLEPGHPTALADQYSLGCVLYFAATGSPPFPDAMAIDRVYAHQRRFPRPIQELRPGLRPELTQAIERLMSKAPHDRLRKVGELTDLLAPFAGADALHGHLPPSVPVDVQTPLPAKIFRKRDFLAESRGPNGGASEELPEAEVLSETPHPGGTRTPRPRRGFWSRFWGPR